MELNGNAVNAALETVVASPEEDPDIAEAEGGVETAPEESVSVPEGVAAPKQTPEENEAFANLRRKYEDEQKKMAASQERLLNALGAYGYSGSADEIADMIIAQAENISVEEARGKREQTEEALEKETRQKQEMDFYKQLAIEKMMADDLGKIQKVYPEVATLEDLGEDFFSALGYVQDPVFAYELYAAKRKRETKLLPPEIGGVNEQSGKEKDFYTPEEVDKLTNRDYEKNPGLMDIVRKSMLKWK